MLKNTKGKNTKNTPENSMNIARTIKVGRLSLDDAQEKLFSISV
jgi:hypothetical protein